MDYEIKFDGRMSLRSTQKDVSKEDDFGSYVKVS